MADDASDLVAQFIAFTGVDDTSKAMQMLEATNNDIQAAVELYFAAHADAPGPNLGGAGVGQDVQAMQDTEDTVRAPIPTKIDRLMGSPVDDDRERRRRRQQHQQQAAHLPIMDAFRARREESMMMAAGQFGGAGSAGSAGNFGDIGNVPRQATTSNPSNVPPVDAHWADQFEPPQALLFHDGDCEDAAMAARDAKKWLVVNIQSPSSFDSHRLNRDTWKDASMQAMLPVSFILYQTYDVSEEGRDLAGGWGITEFPVILVVDPVTGAPMKKWHGFVRPDELIEELVPYMDTSFDDPEAATLFRKRAPGRRMESNSQAPVDVGHPTESTRPMASVLDRAPSSVPTSTGAPAESIDLCDSPPSSAQTGAVPPTEETVDVEAIRRHAENQLPAEPPNEDKPCRIALRLPDGARVQRKFPSGAPLQMIKTWCTSLSDEAARGRAFAVVEAVPGAAPIDLDAPGRTIGEAGIAGVMLGMKWADN